MSTPDQQQGAPPPANRTRETDVEKLLSDLDSLAPMSPGRPGNSAAHPVPSIVAPDNGSNAPDAQSLLDDLDSLVQRRPASRNVSGVTNPEATTPNPAPASRGSLRAATPKSGPSSPPAFPSTPASATPAPAAHLSQSPSQNSASTSAAPAPPVSEQKSSWGGWGSVWNQATKFADQARAELEKHAKLEQATAQDVTEGKGMGDLSALGGALGARGWGLAQNVRHYVQEQSGLDLEKIGSQVTQAGRRGLNDLIHAVSAPVAEHDILRVQVSHDMDGYEGIVDVVFQTMSRVLEQHASDSSIEHHLIIDRIFLASDSPEKRTPTERHLHPVEGLDVAAHQASQLIKQLVSDSSDEPSNPSQKEKDKITEIHQAHGDKDEATEEKGEVSTSTDTIYLRLQPTYAPLPWGSSGKTAESKSNLFFVLHLYDPAHDLTFTTLSQPVPSSFFEVSFEDNVWVEQSLTDVIEVATGILTHDYLGSRLTLRNAEQDKKQQEAAADASANMAAHSTA